MPEQIIEVNANTLEDARAQVKAQTAPGWFLQSEKIVADGQPGTCRAVADTVDQAFAKAEVAVPMGVNNTERKEVHTPFRETRMVQACDEPSAQSQICTQLTDEMTLETLTLSSSGAKGFLGIGRKPNTYAAVVFQPAVVEITYQQPAHIIATITDNMTDWTALTTAVKGLNDGANQLTSSQAFELPLIEQYPHQVLFILSRMDFDPRHYDGVPFTPVSSRAIEKSIHYVDNTDLPGMLGMLGGLEKDRYTVRADGSIARECNLMVDTSIVSVASCLPKETINAMDTELVGRRAFDAITHYSNIPVVRYFCSLAYFEETLASKQFSPRKALETLYKGTESLLIELYDELGMGEVINDDNLTRKVKTML